MNTLWIMSADSNALKGSRSVLAEAEPRGSMFVNSDETRKMVVVVIVAQHMAGVAPIDRHHRMQLSSRYP